MCVYGACLFLCHNYRRCEIIQSGANVTWDRSIRASTGHHGSSTLKSKILLYLYYIPLLSTTLLILIILLSILTNI